MAVAVTLESETNSYWKLIKDVSAEVKLALIARLSNSLVAEGKPREQDVDALVASIVANAPKDVDITDEEIVEEVRAVRYAK